MLHQPTHINKGQQIFCSIKVQNKPTLKKRKQIVSLLEEGQKEKYHNTLTYAALKVYQKLFASKAKSQKVASQ